MKFLAAAAITAIVKSHTVVPSRKEENTVTIDGNTEVVDINSRMVLDANFKWAGQGDIGRYHFANDVDLEAKCELNTVSVDLPRCFTKMGQKFKFGEAVVVSPVQACTSTSCTVTTNKIVTRTVDGEGSTDVMAERILALLSGFIPGKMNTAGSAATRTGVSFQFKGPGFAQVLFRPICYQLEGQFTFVQETGSIRSPYDRMTTFCVPVLLSDGSLDGVYELYQVN